MTGTNCLPTPANPLAKRRKSGRGSFQFLAMNDLSRPRTNKVSDTVVFTLQSICSDPFWSLRSSRFWLGIMLALGVATNNLMRTTMGMALVCMVNSTHVSLSRSPADNFTSLFANATTVSTAADDEDICGELERQMPLHYDGHLHWSPAQQSSLISAAFWGAIIGSAMGGWLSDRYGPKILLIVCSLVHILVTLLMPVTANNTPYIYVSVLRFILGIVNVSRRVTTVSMCELGCLRAPDWHNDQSVVRAA